MTYFSKSNERTWEGSRMKRVILITVSVVFLTQCSGSSHVANQQTRSNQQTVLNGQTIRWQKYGITFTVPPNWTKDTTLSDREDRLGDHTTDEQTWRGAKDQRFEMLVDTCETDFPASIDEMLAADLKSSAGNSAYQDVRYLEINGVKGLSWRQGDDLNIRWLTYRHYKNKAQMIGITAAGSQNDLDLLTKILMSTKIETQ